MSTPRASNNTGCLLGNHTTELFIPQEVDFATVQEMMQGGGTFSICLLLLLVSHGTTEEDSGRDTAAPAANRGNGGVADGGAALEPAPAHTEGEAAEGTDTVPAAPDSETAAPDSEASADDAGAAKPPGGEKKTAPASPASAMDEERGPPAAAPACAGESDTAPAADSDAAQQFGVTTAVRIDASFAGIAEAFLKPARLRNQDQQKDVLRKANQSVVNLQKIIDGLGDTLSTKVRFKQSMNGRKESLPLHEVEDMVNLHSLC